MIHLKKTDDDIDVSWLMFIQFLDLFVSSNWSQPSEKIWMFSLERNRCGIVNENIEIYTYELLFYIRYQQISLQQRWRGMSSVVIT